MVWRRLFGGGSSAGGAGPAKAAAPSDLDVVRAYHEVTKHAPQRFARGPAYMDWDTQPDPFLRWRGADILPLALAAPTPEPRYEDVVAGRPPARPLDRDFVSLLMQDSLALSAWKRAGEAHWSLRVNPSSGNLHPTEAYLLAPPIEGLSEAPFVAHYAPREHALEVRARPTHDQWRALAAPLPGASLVVVLTSIHWREAWKYGERAFRYCNHDVGHALACVALAASALGYECTLLDGLGSDELAVLLDLRHPRGAEAEVPEVALALHPRGTQVAGTRLPAAAISPFEGLAWAGVPSVLSSDHEDWDVIEMVARATRKPANVVARTPSAAPWPALVGAEDLSFRRIARQRRSAVAMDGRSGLARDAFYQTLRRTLAGRGEVPYNALAWSPRIHLALFVHRVGDLDPGLYLLVRDRADEAALRSACDPSFLWTRPPACPDELPLFLLRTGDARGLAARLSCDQAIAGDGCFSLGMLARFEASLAEDGPWMYPRLFWEAGALGQALYLEAEALGLRATGIGCYYDDLVHTTLGLQGRAWQSLYHFTVGAPVDDPRITSEPAYPVAETDSDFQAGPAVGRAPGRPVAPLAGFELPG